MNLYNISCYSKCGSYFQPYLQEVFVLAENEKDALKMAKDAYKGEFVSNKFQVDLLSDIANEPKIVYARYDTDY